MKSDLAIAREATIRPITAVAASIGLAPEDIIPFGHSIAKLPLTLQSRLSENANGKLILVTAMTPTPQGEGKTTNTIGLGQSLSLIGKKCMVAIREPSLGPCFGVKGGAAGGGYSQVLPMEQINLHFTGDMHAVTMAHNLLSAILDNHLHQKNEPQLNPRRVTWKRVLDMNDRALRHTIVGLEGSGTNGVMREDGFEITAASEVMAILCLARDLPDLKWRLGNIVVGYNNLYNAVTVRELGVAGAMAALLKDALAPNLVQTIEGTPVLVHGGPFANIAHGCNTLIATRMALKLADYVVTEAGFGADLGAEKFFDIKCRLGDLSPDAAVLVVTQRAIALHGIENVRKHVANMALFKIPVVVSINKFADDNISVLQEVKKTLTTFGIDAEITDFRESGGSGGTALAEKIVTIGEHPAPFEPLYALTETIIDKIAIIATKIYGAAAVEYTTQAKQDIDRLEKQGFGTLPVCIAKTSASLSDNPKLPGCPVNFTITVSAAKVSAGAGFVVVYTGKVMTMPGLPRKPAALAIDVDDDGVISGLF